jgi:hypothetical protein
MSDKIKPCPFCGGEAHLVQTGLPDRYRIECSWNALCFAHKTLVEYLDRDVAIEQWNKRAQTIHKSWERMENPYGELEGFMCVCGHQSQSATNYCPHCGAKMDGSEIEGRKRNNEQSHFY